MTTCDLSQECKTNSTYEKAYDKNLITFHDLKKKFNKLWAEVNVLNLTKSIYNPDKINVQKSIAFPYNLPWKIQKLS